MLYTISMMTEKGWGLQRRHFSGLQEDDSSPPVCRSPECHSPLVWSVGLVTVSGNVLLTWHHISLYHVLPPAFRLSSHRSIYCALTLTINPQFTHIGMGSPRGKIYKIFHFKLYNLVALIELTVLYNHHHFPKLS